MGGKAAAAVARGCGRAEAQCSWQPLPPTHPQPFKLCQPVVRGARAAVHARRRRRRLAAAPCAQAGRGDGGSLGTARSRITHKATPRLGCCPPRARRAWAALAWATCGPSPAAHCAPLASVAMRDSRMVPMGDARVGGRARHAHSRHCSRFDFLLRAPPAPPAPLQTAQLDAWRVGGGGKVHGCAGGRRSAWPVHRSGPRLCVRTSPLAAPFTLLCASWARFWRVGRSTRSHRHGCSDGQHLRAGPATPGGTPIRFSEAALCDRARRQARAQAAGGRGGCPAPPHRDASQRQGGGGVWAGAVRGRGRGGGAGPVPAGAGAGAERRRDAGGAVQRGVRAGSAAPVAGRHRFGDAGGE